MSRRTDDRVAKKMHQRIIEEDLTTKIRNETNVEDGLAEFEVARRPVTRRRSRWPDRRAHKKMHEKTNRGRQNMSKKTDGRTTKKTDQRTMGECLVTEMRK